MSKPSTNPAIDDHFFVRIYARALLHGGLSALEKEYNAHPFIHHLNHIDICRRFLEIYAGIPVTEIIHQSLEANGNVPPNLFWMNNKGIRETINKGIKDALNKRVDYLIALTH